MPDGRSPCQYSWFRAEWREIGVDGGLPQFPAQPGDAQGQVDVEGAVALLPVRAQQRRDAVQALVERVRVDRQLLGRRGLVTAVAEEDLRRVDQVGAAVFVV